MKVNILTIVSFLVAVSSCDNQPQVRYIIYERPSKTIYVSPDNQSQNIGIKNPIPHFVENVKNWGKKVKRSIESHKPCDSVKDQPFILTNKPKWLNQWNSYQDSLANGK